MIFLRQKGRGWLAMIAMLIAVLLGAPPLASAQNDSTPPSTGHLTIHSYQCQIPDQTPGAVLLQASGNLGDAGCEPGDPVSVDIDGTQITLGDGESIDVPVGEHVVTEISNGTQLSVA